MTHHKTPNTVPETLPSWKGRLQHLSRFISGDRLKKTDTLVNGTSLPLQQHPPSIQTKPSLFKGKTPNIALEFEVFADIALV